jgi:anthraniloyl-CoA monooxygenase
MPNPKSKIQNPKSKIVVLGAGPAGLYCALLVKKAAPTREITIIERNPADVTYGWGVVFSDRTLASFERADYKTYKQITDQFVIWDSIDVRYRGETVRCGGHVIASISRKLLLNILQRRCIELGIDIHFSTDIHDLSELPEHDLLIAADGVNSLARKSYEEQFQPRIEWGNARYIWLGAERVLDAFTFIFHENEHGFFTTHAYPFSGTTSTFIVECSEATWLKAGLDKTDEAQSLAYCQELLADDLGGVPLLSNNSKWINFPTLKTKNWHIHAQSPSSKIRNPKSEIRNVVLLGDAVHTAHFSIGAGTKLAMEDAIALASALEQHSDTEAALSAYELERKPVVETFQRAASESQTYFETIARYRQLPPMQFAFQLLTRSGRISYSDLHLRDPRFGDEVNRWYERSAECGSGRRTKDEDSEGRRPELGVAQEPAGGSNHTPHSALAPPPIFAPLHLRDLTFPNRIILPMQLAPANNGAPDVASLDHDTNPKSPHSALRTPHSAFIGVCAVSSEGRVTPDTVGMYSEGHGAAWARIVAGNHSHGSLIGVSLSHAGRRGSTRPRSEGLDRPLREGGWPILSASPIPYTLRSQVPREMDRADIERVRDEFVRAARMAHEAGFDFLQIDCARGYLLATFLSPLTNRREDDYGGDLAGRMRFPLEIFGAVRAAWPEGKPLSVALSATDHVKGGSQVEDAVAFAIALKERGCDLVEVLAGQTVPHGEPPYGRGFLTHYSDRIRNEAGVPTMVGGHITTSNEANTILAAGRADLCILTIDDRR